MKRYSCFLNGSGVEPFVDSEEAPDGEWVKQEDVAAIMVKYATLLVLRRKLLDVLMEFQAEEDVGGWWR